VALPVDILVMAALGDAVTRQNMRSIKAKYIIELANGPVNEAADEYLSKQGRLILPDIISNAGGVIVSYFEWLQNIRHEHWSVEVVNNRLEKYIVKATTKMYQTATTQNISLKEAAFVNAIKNLL
jgi:glutamate dehydrogenase/leucine dehydrogenase